jgi:hypothetical protein
MGIILDNSGFDSGATVQANSTNIILGLTIGIGVCLVLDWPDFYMR